MKYVSTRNKAVEVTSSFAIANGISVEGGLFVPNFIPKLKGEDFDVIKGLKYNQRAKYILKNFLTDFSEDELDYCVNGAYIGTFDEDKPAPLYSLTEGVNILEL